MKIVTLAAIKGGVGKTTITYNYGEWLAEQGNKVLLIDLDHQCNLSQTYNVYDSQKTAGNIFDPNSDGTVEIHHVKENIDLIAGDMNLDKKEQLIENEDNKNMFLFLWIYNHKDELNFDQYNYVLIDTHPDFSIATKNAIVVSNDVLSPITPSEHGYNAKWNLDIRFNNLKKSAMDYHSMESYVTANLYFVANRVKAGTKSSRDLIKKLKEEKENGDESCIALLPEKELFNRSTIEKKSISEMAQNKSEYHRNQEFFDNINKSFSEITDKL